MVCPKCKSEMAKTTGRYQYRECGLDYVWLVNWDIFVCPNCGLRMASLPDATAAARTITNWLVRQKAKLDGDAILFLRKAMGYKATELATILGVTRVQVSRWENQKSAIDTWNDLKLRLEAIDRLLPPTDRRGVREEITLIFQRSYGQAVLEELAIDVGVNLLIASAQNQEMSVIE